MNGFIKCTILLLFIFTAGCQTFETPRSPYQTWTPPEKVETAIADDPVWESIRKKEIDASSPLTLVELIDIALYNSPQTHEAWENARAAQAVQGQAESQYIPQGGVSGTVTRQKTNVSVDSNLLKYGPALQITYLLFDFGAREAAVREAAQLLLAANYQFNQSLQDIVLSVEKAYYGLYSSKSSLEAAEADLEDAKTAYEAAQQSYEVGLGSKLDLLQEKTNYDNALYALEEAKEGIKVAHADLAQTLGYPADTEIQIADPPSGKKIPTDITEEDVSVLIEEALAMRPDIKALQANLRAAESTIKTYNSGLYPNLNAGGSAEKDWYKYYGDTTGKDNTYDYSGYLSINWDVFDVFYYINKKREAEAQRDAARDQLAQAELQASTDVWTNYYAFKAAVQKLTYSETALENAQASYDYALEGYNSGLKSVLDLLHAQASLSDARSQLIDTKKDLFFALADLAHSTGTINIPKIDIPIDTYTNNIEYSYDTEYSAPLMNFEPRK